jgi:hypothetical protein
MQTWQHSRSGRGRGRHVPLRTDSRPEVPLPRPGTAAKRLLHAHLGTTLEELRDECSLFLPLASPFSPALPLASELTGLLKLPSSARHVAPLPHLSGQLPHRRIVEGLCPLRDCAQVACLCPVTVTRM